MASRKRRASEALPSDPQILLDYFDALPSDDDSCSDSEFDGYVEDFDEDYCNTAPNDGRLHYSNHNSSLHTAQICQVLPHYLHQLQEALQLSTTLL